MKYKIIVDKQPRTNPSTERKTYEIDIEELRYKDDVKDTLVITKDEDYVIRRLELSEYHVLSVLDTPKKEILKDINIELFEKDNYIYIADETGNRFYAEYLIKNEFNDMYVIKNELNSAIEQTVNSIELSVNNKLAGYSTTAEMNAAINISEQNITSTVSETYITKTDSATNINNAKTEAINGANSSTDTKLQNYSTTTQMNTAIEQSANSINQRVSDTETIVGDQGTTLGNLATNINDLDNELNNVNSNITTINENYSDLKQTVDGWDFSVVTSMQKQLENGTVTSNEVHTTSVSITDAGISVGKSDSQIKSLLDNEGLYVNSGNIDKTTPNNNLLKADINGVTTENLLVRTYATLGYIRIEKSIENNKKKTSIFWAGGE